MNEKDVSDRLRSFGLRVKHLRVCRSITQEELAELTGLFRTYLSRIESGQANPTLTVMYALAKALHVEVCELFKELDEEAPLVVGRVRSESRPSRGRVAK